MSDLIALLPPGAEGRGASSTTDRGSRGSFHTLVNPHRITYGHHGA